MSSNFPSVNEQMDFIKIGTSEIIPEEDLVKKIEKSLKDNKPLNIKLGCDPTRPDLHLGHSVVLRKLAQFQSLGHTAILIIGDFTAMIGDPSGRNSSRPPLSLEESKRNGESYFQQASKILHPENTKIVHNSEWLGKMTFEEVIKLSAKYTVARMLERDDFTKRYKTGIPISMHEILYPLAQAMDSVAIKSDVELGGTDQKFNLLVGRDIQREFGQDPQVIITLPLLVGTDGVEKMSKSYGNYIAINDTPQDIFGKTMSIPDSLIFTYYELVTNLNKSQLNEIEGQLKNPEINPRDLKRNLGKILVSMYYDEDTAEKSIEEFDKIFIKKDIPDEIEEFNYSLTGKQNIMEIMVLAKLAPSKSEARRLVAQGGVSINSEKINDINAELEINSGDIIKVGKRKFLKFVK